MHNEKKESHLLTPISRRGMLKLSALGLITAALPIYAHAQSAKPIRVLLAPDANIVPGQLRGGGSTNVASCLYDWLFRLEGEGQTFTNSLAEKTQHSDDFKTWDITLRKGVKFSNGTEATARDLVFTMARHQDDKIGSPLKDIFQHVSDITETDAQTVTFTLSRPDPDFLLKFLDKNAALLAHDYDYAANGNSKPCGTGPFDVEEYVPSQYMRLRKKANYFIPGLPKADTLEIMFIADQQTQLLSLESGQGDIIRTVPFDQLKRYESHSDLDLKSLPSAYFTPISMRTDRKPFDDPRVRLAMKLVVNRQQMLDNAAFGYGEIADDDYVWPGFRYYKKRPAKEQDIEGAKRLLAEAGYPDGIDVEIVCEANRPPVMDVVLLYQQMARAANIRVNIQAVSTDIFYAKHFMKATVVCASWGHREALDLLSVSVQTDAVWNESRYSNAEVDKLITQASAEGELGKRQEIMGRIQEILSEDGAAIIPFFHNVFAATRKDVAGFQLTENWINDYRHVART
ncbi:MAG: ABC transporter substrate-binding protein [Burkholderiaceae bacterium]|nr:ABC transporter substrate-binding protein [Burkholderiaceae bacterium]